MGFSPERITFMTMGRLHRAEVEMRIESNRANSQAKLGVVSG